MVFHEITHLLQPFAQTLTKTPKRGSLHEKLQVLAKSTIFHVFSRNVLPLLAEKFVETPKHGGFFQNLDVLAKSTIFRVFSEMRSFCHFWLKSSSKRRNTVVSSKSCKFWPNRRFFVFFREMRHFLRLLAEKFVKTPKNGGFFEKLEVLAKSTIFRVFSRNEALFATFG